MSDFRRLATWLLCKPKEGKQANDIFLRNCKHRIVSLMSVFVQNIVDMISDCALVVATVAVLKKRFLKITEGRL